MYPYMGETDSKYQTLTEDPAKKEICTTVVGKKLGNLAQCDAKKISGTNSIFSYHLWT